MDAHLVQGRNEVLYFTYLPVFNVSKLVVDNRKALLATSGLTKPII